MNKESVKGYLFVIVSAVIFGLSPIAAKVVYANGGTPIIVLLFRSASFPLLFMMAKGQRCSMKLTVTEGRKILILGLLGATITPLCTLNAYVLIPSGTATTIHYMYCVFILLECVLFYHDKLDIKKAICIALCMLGVFLLYAPDEAGNLLGLTLALISAITYATYSVYLEKSGMHAMNVFKIQFYMNLVSFICISTYTAISGQFAFSIAPAGWVIMIAYYSFGMVSASMLFQLGVHYIGSQRAAILSTFEPLTSVILGILVFGDLLNIRIIMGISIILMSAIIITTTRGAVSKKQAKHDDA
ncbi:MAG: DMT family transporter [Clostridia bacterium]